MKLMILRGIFFSMLCLLFITCANNDNSDALLEQAGQVHLEAVEVDKKIQSMLPKFVDIKQQIEQKQTDRTPEENQILKQITALESRYAFWKENYVEVPGLEHDHDHDHDHSHHDHGHGSQVEVSPEDMLLIQQEFKDSLSSIALGLEQLEIPEYLVAN